MALRGRRTRGQHLWRRLAFIAIIFVLSVSISYVVRENAGFGQRHHGGADVGGINEPRVYDDFAAAGGGGRGRIRRLLEVSSSPGLDFVTDGGVHEEEINCTPSTIEEFPPDIFTKEQRANGAIILHTLMAVYMFVALAIVCDDYFVSSLEKICEKLNLAEDVAGATFMAAGSSAPELFTSIIGVFIAKGDVGVGTIVGSAVFNILIIIGICGLFAGQVVPLTWWPLFRDTLVYSLSVITLVLVIRDGYIRWYESLVMLCMYFGYVILMSCNPRLSSGVRKLSERRRKKRESCNNEKSAIQLEQVTPLNATEEPTSNGEKKDARMVDEYIGNSPKRLTFSDAGLRLMLTKQFPARTRLRTACRLIITEQRQMMENEAAEFPSTYAHRPSLGDTEKNGSVPRSDSICKDESVDMSVEKEGTEDAMSEQTFPVSEAESPLAIPDGKLNIFKWLMTLPISVLLFFTVPDCRRKRFDRWYMVTFFMSVAWIAIFSYIMVWMVAYIGYTLQIPDTIMGITFLAAGTSVPDAIASLLVAREGLGDMAVSNSVGSNVFDILVGLALPWFVKTTCINYGSVIRINSKGLLYSVLLLFASVAATILAIHFNKWKLDKRLGVLLVLFYLVFLSFSIMVEFNVFGYVNPPICAH
ncbi:sodium/potassium/calcium exchanger 3-like [Diadema antillarum]|uniref:sodium/potassium/calcium exchanger 3-like n=1 Tax=Diadema antillarum TaxID=105358 RepID=UPI003A8945BE